MGILSRIFGALKGDGAAQPEQKPPEVEEIIKVPGGVDEYISYLRTERKEKTRPIVSRKDVTEKFYSYRGKEFDFSAVPVYHAGGSEVEWYLLDGANADKAMGDLLSLDLLAAEANEMVPEVNFKAPALGILLTPEWVENGLDMRWNVSHMSPLPLTKTGNPPKYPFRVYFVDKTGKYDARVKYTQNDEVGEAEITVGDPAERYQLVIRGGKIIRIVKRQGAETFPVYSTK